MPFDGDGMREYLVDEYVRDDSDAPVETGLRAGSVLEVPRGEVRTSRKGTCVRGGGGGGSIYVGTLSYR